MPIYSIQAPDGRTYSIEGPEGASQQEVIQQVLAQHPTAGTPPKPVTGIMGAFGSGLEQGIGETARGIGELTGIQSLKQYGREKETAAKTYQPISDDELQAAKKEGLFPEIGAYARKYGEEAAQTIGSVAGRFGAPTIAAAAAPEGLAAGLVFGAINAGTYIGNKVADQKDKGEAPDYLRATAYGLAHAAIDQVTGHILHAPMRGVLGKTAAEEAMPLAQDVLAGKLTAEEASQQLSGTLRNVIQGTGQNAVVGTGMMVGHEMLNRMEEGKSLISPDAMEAYGRATVGAIGMAPIFGLLHGTGARSAAEKTLSTAEQARSDLLGEQQKQADSLNKQQKDAYQQTDSYLVDLQDQAAQYGQQLVELKKAAAAKVDPTDQVAVAEQRRAKQEYAELVRSDEYKDFQKELQAAVPRIREFQERAKKQQEEQAATEQAAAEAQAAQEEAVRKQQAQAELEQQKGYQKSIISPEAQTALDNLPENQTPQTDLFGNPVIPQPASLAAERERGLYGPEARKLAFDEVYEKTKKLKELAGEKFTYADIPSIKGIETHPLLRQEVPEVQAPDYHRQAMLLEQQLEAIKTKATQATDPNQIIALAGQHEQVQTALAEAKKLADKQEKPLDVKLAETQKKLADAVQLGKLNEAAKHAQTIIDLQNQGATEGMPLKKLAGSESTQAFNTRTYEPGGYEAPEQQRLATDPIQAEREYQAEVDELRRQGIVNPEAEALRRIKERNQQQSVMGPASGQMTDLFGERTRTPAPSSAAIGQMKQRILGEDVTYTAPSERTGQVQRGGPAEFKLYPKATPEEAPTKESLINRIDTILNNKDVPDDTRQFLERVANNMPEGNDSGFHDLVNEQLNRIEQGNVSFTREAGRGYVFNEGLPSTGNRKYGASETGGTKANVSNISQLGANREPLMTENEQRLQQNVAPVGTVESVGRTAETLSRTPKLSLQPEIEERLRLYEELKQDTAGYQKELFPELATATVRATPGNFRRLLESKGVQELRDNIREQKAEAERTRKEVDAALPSLEKATAKYEATLKELQDAASEANYLKEPSKEEVAEINKTVDKLSELRNNIQANLAEISDMRQSLAEANETNTARALRVALKNPEALRKAIDFPYLEAEEPKLQARLKEVSETLENAVALRDAIVKFQKTETRMASRFAGAAEERLTAAEREFQTAQEELREQRNAANQRRRIENAERTGSENPVAEITKQYEAHLAEIEAAINRLESDPRVDKTQIRALNDLEKEQRGLKPDAEPNNSMYNEYKDRSLKSLRSSLSILHKKAEEAKQAVEAARAKSASYGNGKPDTFRADATRKTIEDLQGRINLLKENLNPERSRKLPESTRVSMARGILQYEKMLEAAKDRLAAEQKRARENTKVDRGFVGVFKGMGEALRTHADLELRIEAAEAALERKMQEQEQEHPREIAARKAAKITGIPRTEAMPQDVGNLTPFERAAFAEQRRADSMVRESRELVEKLERKVKNARNEKKAEAHQQLTQANLQLEEAIRQQGILAGRVSQATRIVSAGPAKLRTGTAESRATPGSVRQPIVERRTKGSLYRVSERVSPDLDMDLHVSRIERLVNALTGAWKQLPEIKVVRSYDELPDYIRADAERDGVADKIPGVFHPETNAVWLVGDHLASKEDVIATVAHEIIGHFGMRKMLGDKYTHVMDRIYKGNEAVRAAVDAKMEGSNLSRQVATEEVLAEMAEKEETSTPEKRSALKQIYDTVRRWIYDKFGVGKMTDNDVRQIVADAGKLVMRGEGEAAGEAARGGSGALYRTTNYGTSNGLTDFSKKIIAEPKSLKERFKPSSLALQAEMQAVDMRAPLREALKAGAEGINRPELFKQAMYHITKNDQKVSLAMTTMSNGPLEVYRDTKGLYGIRSTNKNSGADVFKAISAIPQGDAQAKVNLATAYMIAQRAANKGLNRLDLGALDIKQADLDAAMAAADANPKLKAALENVRAKYNAYNEGLIKFNVSTGAIPSAMAKELLKDGDYVPFYRVDSNGQASLVFNDNVRVQIGDVRNQPYLDKLKAGETKILPLNESMLQNTLLLTDKAMTTLAQKSVAYALQEIGKGRIPPDNDSLVIHKGHGPADPSVIHFQQEPDPANPKDDGKRWMKVDTKGTLMDGIDPALVVRSLEGTQLALPSYLKLAGSASDLLRTGATRTPLYIAHQLLRDPMAATMTGGVQSNPFMAVLRAGKNYVQLLRGTSDTGKALIEKGLIQSGIFKGDKSDISKFALQLADGKDLSAIEKLVRFADKAAMEADAATRTLVYEDAIKQGLSEVEADMATMESMNFHKRGASASIQHLNRMIPFYNSQIQGLNVLAKAARGNMPYEEQLNIKRKFFNNAMLLAAGGLAYGMAMADNEYYKNAKPYDRYTNMFVFLPGVKEPVKIPIPYEVGWFFSLGAAAADAMRGEVRGEDQRRGLAKMFLNSVPGYSSQIGGMPMPQLLRPTVEVAVNKDFNTGNPIVSARLAKMDPAQQYTNQTTEVAKFFGQMTGVSPVMAEHLVRGYFGQMPLAAAAAAESLFKPAGATPTARASDLPFIGSAFQRRYGGAEQEAMYQTATEAIQKLDAFNSMKKEGRGQDAREYFLRNRGELMIAPAAQKYEQLMSKLNADTRMIQARNMNPDEKRARLDKLDAAREQVSAQFLAATEKIKAFGKTAPQ